MREAVGISVFTRPHDILAASRTAHVGRGSARGRLSDRAARPAPTFPPSCCGPRLFGAEGFGIWNNWWYAGQNVTGYSVLFPPLAWLTPRSSWRPLACVGTAAAFEALAHDAYGDDAWLGATWLAAATVTELLSGRLTFAFGLCGVALTALSLERQRPRSAAVLACVTALASPVAGLFAALAGLVGRRPSVVVASLLPLVALAITFPQPGYQPFAFGTLWPLLVVGCFILILRPGRVIGTATLLYLLGCIAAYADSHAGGEQRGASRRADRGPVVALLLVPRRAWLLLALAAVPLTYIQVHDAITDLEHGSQASTAAYYRPLIGFLGAAAGDLAGGGPVHTRALGELLAGAAGAARTRVGAPERHRRQPALLRRQADRCQLRRLAAPARRALRGGRRRARRLLRARRVATDPQRAAVPPCGGAARALDRVRGG